MSCRHLLVVALIVTVPRFAAAQFTTFIPPRPIEKPVVVSVKPKAVAAKRKVQVETLPRIRLTDMRIWVDSAVGIPSSPLPASKPGTPPPTPPLASPSWGGRQ